MEESPRHLNRMVRRLARLFREKFAAIAITATGQFQVFNVPPFGSKSCGGNVHGLCELGERIEGKNRSGTFGFTEILELTRHLGDSLVEYVPDKSTRLSQHFGGLLRVAARFVAESVAVAIDLDAPLHDDRQLFQVIWRVPHGAMA